MPAFQFGGYLFNGTRQNYFSSMPSIAENRFFPSTQWKKKTETLNAGVKNDLENYSFCFSF